MSRLAKLAEMLQSEPNDPFLNYAFALETSKEDRPAALNLLAEMNTKFPDSCWPKWAMQSRRVRSCRWGSKSRVDLATIMRPLRCTN
jgi:hypothetical protein